MSWDNLHGGMTPEQVKQMREREAYQRERERLDDDEELVGIIRSLPVEEIDDDDLIQRRRHRVARK
jgi:hypothetical protein